MAPATLQASLDKLYEVLDHPGLEAERLKIQKKLDEARFSKGDPRILADCMLALLLIGKDWGFTAEQLLDELQHVAGDASQRQWKRMADGTYQAF